MCAAASTLHFQAAVSVKQRWQTTNIQIKVRRENVRAHASARTCLSRVDEDGRMGRQNFFMEPMAAGKAGAENSAATRLIRKIHDIISSSLLTRQMRARKHIGDYDGD